VTWSSASRLSLGRSQLEAQADRRAEIARLGLSMAEFCRRVSQGLAQASWEQRRQLIEWLVARVVVTDGEVEIRYVIPTSSASEAARFCHLRSDYRDRARHPQVRNGP
jgi:site-specific DNA recombinase